MNLLEAINIEKSFGEVKALLGVDFAVGKNEIVGLIGDNGAGKSTLVKILMGVYPPDKGQIYFEGKIVEDYSVQKAKELGIDIVYQEQALADLHTIWRNIFMGREIRNRLGFIKIRESKEKSMEILREIGFRGDIGPDSVIWHLSGGEREGVAIARTIYSKAKLVILDEPTTALSIKETEKVIQYIRRIKELGNSCIFITHNLYHVYPVAERFVILDRGKKVADIPKEETSLDDVADRLRRARGL